MGEQVPPEQLAVRRAGVVLADEPADAAHVVVAEEGRQRGRVAVGVGVVVVARVELGEPRRPGSAAAERARRLLEGEVQRGVQPAARGVTAGHGGVAGVHLAEHEEALVAELGRVAVQGGGEALPELHVDVLGRVDPEAVDSGVTDPRLVDVGHPPDDLGALGPQVVEAGEVAVLVGLAAAEGGVAPVVVHRRVVEPGGGLHPLLRDRRVRERVRVDLGEGVLARVVAVVERPAVDVDVRVGGLGPVGVGLLLVVDDVRGVVGDDVEEDLHPALVRLADELLHLRVGAEVRVDRGEVGDPVAVVPGRGVGPLALDRPVLERGGQPDRRAAEILDVVQLADQTGEVAALVEALVGGVESGAEPVAREPALVVAGVAVGEPVGHREVEPLARQTGAQGIPRQVLVGGVRLAAQRGYQRFPGVRGWRAGGGEVGHRLGGGGVGGGHGGERRRGQYRCEDRGHQVAGPACGRPSRGPWGEWPDHWRLHGSYFMGVARKLLTRHDLCNALLKFPENNQSAGHGAGSRPVSMSSDYSAR